VIAILVFFFVTSAIGDLPAEAGLAIWWQWLA